MVFADFFFHAFKNAANAKRRYTSIPNQYIRMLGFQSLIVGFERSKLINKLDDTTEVIFMKSNNFCSNTCKSKKFMPDPEFVQVGVWG